MQLTVDKEQPECGVPYRDSSVQSSIDRPESCPKARSFVTSTASMLRACEAVGTKLPAAEMKLILKAVSWRVEAAPPFVAKVHKPGKLTAHPMLGLYDAVVAGKSCVVEYEPDADLRDTEQVPLLEEGGIEAFIRREVLPYTPDAWVNNDATKIGYEISFTLHFYKPQPLRTLAEISADILAIEKDAEGLLDGLLVEATQP